MHILIISDNKFLIEQFYRIILEKNLVGKYHWEFVCSRNNLSLLDNDILPVSMKSIDLANDYSLLKALAASLSKSRYCSLPVLTFTNEMVPPLN